MVMMSDIDVLLGLYMAAKYSENAASAIMEKANSFNRSVSQITRKNILIPIMNTNDPVKMLDAKTTEYLNRKHNRGF